MMAQFSLSWDDHKNSVYSGLSTLQKNGEFVDMTLAADGHHVKVHQMVLSLASPYIKDIITSIQCQHPVIFLNKISYATLHSMLEYIYTGEVMVKKDNLPQFLEACRELQLRGLEDMKVELAQDEIPRQVVIPQNKPTRLEEKEVRPVVDDESDYYETEYLETQDDVDDANMNDDENFEAMVMDTTGCNEDTHLEWNMKCTKSKDSTNKIQYAVSSHGSLQLILNRYIYYLRHTSKRQTQNGHRMWRCANYVREDRCPATVITLKDSVVKRFAAHNHPQHDDRIKKKVTSTPIYSAVDEAESVSKNIKHQRQLIIPNEGSYYWKSIK